MRINKANKAFYVWAAVSLACMAAIFGFSAQNAEQSSQLSGALTDNTLAVILRRIGIEIEEPLAEALEVFIRKTAHVFIYFILGLCATNTFAQIIKEKRRLFVISLSFCSFYAATDELHQYFVPGRACMLQDWLFDTIGSLLAVCAAVYVLRVRGTSVKDKAN